jgi:hypothetical protein
MKPYLNNELIMTQELKKYHISCRIWNYVAVIKRNEELDGRKYIVVPVTMILEGVHAGNQGPIYYSEHELSKTPSQWNMKPLLLFHPKKGDTGTDLEIYKNQAIGMIMNTNWKEGKLKAEAWIDEYKAKSICPEILEKINRNEPMEVSTGLFADCIKEDSYWNGERYELIATNLRADHLAILPNIAGACSMRDGAGLLMNQAYDQNRMECTMQVDTVQNPKTPIISDTLIKNEVSLQQLQEDLVVLLKSRTSQDAWLQEVFETFLVYSVAANGVSELYKISYNLGEDGKPIFEGEPEKVTKHVLYFTGTGDVINPPETCCQMPEITVKATIAPTEDIVTDKLSHIAPVVEIIGQEDGIAIPQVNPLQKSEMEGLTEEEHKFLEEVLKNAGITNDSLLSKLGKSLLGDDSGSTGMRGVLLGGILGKLLTIPDSIKNVEVNNMDIKDVTSPEDKTDVVDKTNMTEFSSPPSVDKTEQEMGVPKPIGPTRQDDAEVEAMTIGNRVIKNYDAVLNSLTKLLGFLKLTPGDNDLKNQIRNTQRILTNARTVGAIDSAEIKKRLDRIKELRMEIADLTASILPLEAREEAELMKSALTPGVDLISKADNELYKTSAPLSPEEQSLLESIRTKLAGMKQEVTSFGTTGNRGIGATKYASSGLNPELIKSFIDSGLL